MSFAKRNDFLLRRLHSLTGVIPVGVFLINHFIANSFAIHGAEAYNHHVELLRSLPYLYAIEIGFIAIPIMFHAFLGMYISFTGQANVGTQNYLRNWFYLFQRITGVILLFFIAWHVYTTRFSGQEDLFALMQAKLLNPAYIAFYVVGVLAATYHFANGMWGFMVTWGITLSPRSQRISTYACIGLFLLLAFAGINSMLAFNGNHISFMNPTGGH